MLQGCLDRFIINRIDFTNLVPVTDKPHVTEEQQILAACIFGVITSVICNSLAAANAKWLLERTDSNAAQTILKLHKRNKTIPETLYQQFQNDFDAYMESQHYSWYTKTK